MQQTLTPASETCLATARPAGPDPTTTKSTLFCADLSNLGSSKVRFSFLTSRASSRGVMVACARKMPRACPLLKFRRGIALCIPHVNSLEPMPNLQQSSGSLTRMTSIC
ncbi:hypothetical protein GOP47_0025337 [Adiantum capillus-veneris]|uniref:Uncharacterized protein n=1 Tax=Adiantum capillus-veneris TaxID=13818 RepID=A0A9D4Z282_ADICA|nr:hypothetical protein GOP47_0025337 [Adiantum capillus-veneris]